MAQAYPACPQQKAVTEADTMAWAAALSPRDTTDAESAVKQAYQGNQSEAVVEGDELDDAEGRGVEVES